MLALLVLVMTVVSLLLPAFTLQKEAFCGEEEHTHTKECYERTAICGFEESDAHEHDDACYESVPVLVCGLEEDEGHTHTEACLESVVALSCGLEEDAGHMHTDACWQVKTVLACGEEDYPEHEHNESCYQEQRELICDEQERAGHIHDESCYTLKEILTCGEQEHPAHTHSEACYENRPVLTCERGETEGHTHTDACYEIRLKCDKPEHKHTLACYANPEADLENEYTWTMSLPAFEEGTPRVYRLLGIARSQLGYHESAANFVLDENENVYGYTRYGAWYGYPYGDWCAMFISFCLHYAGISEDVFPYACSTDEWIAQLNDYGLYYPAGSGYTPRAGDLVFFAVQNGGYSGHVGLVSAVDESNGGFGTIEGNLGDAVARGEYAFGDGRILGYGVLPEALRQEASEYEQRETLRAAIEDAKALEEASKARELEQTEELQSFSGAILSTAYASSETTQSESVKTDANEGEIHLVDAVSSESGKAGALTTESGAELNETKLQQAKRTPGTVTLLGEEPSGNVNLNEIAEVKPTTVSYTGVERGGILDLSFQYNITKLDNAKNAATWTYDLSDVVGDNKDIKSLVTGSGTVWSGDQKTGTYVIENDKIIITPDHEYIKDQEALAGTFNFRAQLNADNDNNKTQTVIEFPGTGTITVTYKENTLGHYKTVGATASSAYGTSGDVQLVEENGKYYLYYQISMTPSAKLTSLSLSDSLSGGQKLVSDSLTLTGGGKTYTDFGDALTTTGDTGFTLDMAKLLKDDGVNPWNYILTYKVEVPETSFNNEQTNTASYTWEGHDAGDEITVTPKFEKDLTTDKTVGGYDNVYVNGGNVYVEKDENGDYYLNYRITAKPNTAVNELTITDTLGAGQKLVGEISVSSDNGTALNYIATNTTDTGFKGTVKTATGEKIPANTTVTLTYKVKLTNNSSDPSSVLGEKTNKASWTWNGTTKDNETTVTTKEPEPLIAVQKLVSQTSAKPGDEITYTITIGDENQDLGGMTFKDYIANYPFTIDGNIELKDKSGNPVSNITISEPNVAPADTATGAEYEYFTVTFPDGAKGPYTLTYTIKLSEDASHAGTKALTNRGVIGRGESTTTTNVDYGTPTIEKKWSAFDRDKDEVEWIITVTVPEGKTLRNVTLDEHSFAGGTSEWWQGDLMTIDWDRTLAANTNIVRDGETDNLHFTTDLTTGAYEVKVYTKLPEGLHFADLSDYYVRNKVNLKVGGDDMGEADAIKRYEKGDFDFTKTGAFDPEKPDEATWEVVINADAKTIDPDVVPYFVDTIPDGMEFVADSLEVEVNGHGNGNGYGNQLWGPWTVNVPYATSDNQIGRIDLVAAVRGSNDPQWQPTGLSGMTYTVRYRTKLTAEMKQKIMQDVGLYSFTNKAKIVDKDGITVKSTGETITYEYKGLIKKTDLTDKDAEASVITYQIEVNPNALKLNNGNPLELYDILKTDVTLLRDTVKIYEGTTSSNTLVYAKGLKPTEGDNREIAVGYEDNTRRLQIYLPDQKAYVVKYDVKPNKGTQVYENTAVLKAGTLYIEDTASQEDKIASSATLTGYHNSITLLKLDLYDITEELPGAEFELYELALDANGKITGETKVESSAADKKFVTDENGKVEFTSIEEGKLYYWAETKAPTGYMLTDNTPHYFVVYQEYNASNIENLTGYSLSNITRLVDNTNTEVFSQNQADTLKNAIEAVLTAGQLTGDIFNPSDLRENNTVLQALINYENLRSNTEAKKIDNRAQSANQITVATVATGYTWNWNNVKEGAHAVLQGNKTLIGRALEADEYSFMLYDVNDPSKEIWLQTMKNDENGAFTFSPIPYREPGTYHYRIREGIPGRDDDVINDPEILYDASTYEVTVVVTKEDLEKTGTVEALSIPAEQITYTKNGENVSGGAKFFNQKDEASIILTKTFSGAYQDTEQVKHSIRFRVKDGDGKVIAEIPYSQFTAGRYTLTKTDGITPDTTYTIEELNANIDGVVRVTTYTVDSRTQQGNTATVNINGDKAAVVDFDNRYDVDTMTLKVMKRWYTEDNKNMTVVSNPPSNMTEIYYKLQRYTGSEENPTTASESNWVFLKRDYTVDDTQPTDATKAFADKVYPFTDYFVLKASFGWGAELENLPVGRYRIIEIEPSGSNWKPISHGNVIYSTTELGNGLIPNADLADAAKFDYDLGVDGEDSDSIYAYNRLYNIYFEKKWKDKDGNEVTDLSKLGVQSVVLQLQSATCTNANANAEAQVFSEWHNVEGQTVMLTYPTPEGSDGLAHFYGIARKDAEGKNLYYRVQETGMLLTDGTVLNAEQVAERFQLVFTPVGKKVKGENGESVQSTDAFNAYMKPGDGVDYGHQTVTNVEQPIGISVTKKWNPTGENAEREDVYFIMQAVLENGSTVTVYNYPDDTKTMNGLYTIKYDSTIKKYTPVTFTYLFMTNIYTQQKYEVPTWDNQRVTGVRFIECDASWNTAENSEYLATYTFEEYGAKSESVGKDGIDSRSNGVYTITNSYRSPTELKVTKNWTDANAGSEITYKLHLVDVDGNDEVLTKARTTEDSESGNDASNVVTKDAEWEDDNTLKLTKKADGTWPITTFTIPKDFRLKDEWNNDAKYVASVYVEEISPGNTNQWHVEYSFQQGESTAVAMGGPDKPITAGEDGTLTIVNTPTSTVRDVSVTKAWTGVEWPGSVASVAVQLWRTSGAAGATPEKVGDPVFLTANSRSYTWKNQPKMDSDNYSYTYYVQEVSILARVEDELQSISPQEWFSDTNTRATMTDATGDLLTVKAEGAATITNKSPTEPTTELTVNKVWLNKEGERSSHSAGETITLRLWSQTNSETQPVAITNLTEDQLTNLTRSNDGNLVLKSTAGGWPTGKITLPKYRGGELIRYYLEELSATDKDGKMLLYSVTYYLNNKPVGDAKSAATGAGDITLVNRETEKYVEAVKTWLKSDGTKDTRSHAAETVTLQLYRWTTGTGTPATAASSSDEKVIAVSAIPSNAEPAKDKEGNVLPSVVLNSKNGDTYVGWQYRWDNLPEYADVAHTQKYHYAVVETQIENTSAESNAVTYQYIYTDGTEDNVIFNDKDVVKVEISNKPDYPMQNTASLKIVKVDAQNREHYLTGAEFKLEKQDETNGSVWVAVKDDIKVESVDGVVVNNLEQGYYRLHEIKAPAGYLILDNDFYFRIDDKGEILSNGASLVRYEAGVLSVGNQPGVQLPSTGGLGAESFRLGGALLLLAALGTGVPALRKAKKEEDEA